MFSAQDKEAAFLLALALDRPREWAGSSVCLGRTRVGSHTRVTLSLFVTKDQIWVGCRA